MNLSLFDKPAHPDMRQSIEALWPHQVKAVAGIREKLAENRSTLCVMATGTGKTRVAQEVIDATPGRVLFLCHRDTLIQQAATRLGRTRRVGIEKAGLYADKSDDVVVGTVQSMYQPGRLAGFARDAFTLLVADECFPAGTNVDGRPIETLRLGDRVWSFDEETGAMVRRHVCRRFASRPRAMVTVWIGGLPTYCTAGHPFLTSRGWVVAASLTSDDVVLRWGDENSLRTLWNEYRREEALLDTIPLLRSMRGGQAGGAKASALDRRSLQGLRQGGHRQDRMVGKQDPSTRWDGVLFGGAQARMAREGVGRNVGTGESAIRLGAHEGEQPDASWRRARAHEDHASCDGLEAYGARRERYRTDGASTAFGVDARVGHGSGRADRHEARLWLPDGLQVGHREHAAQDWDRGGRVFPRAAFVSGAGPQEGRLLAQQRVDGVEVLKPSRDGTFGGVCPDGLVYNVEVAGTHTYVANGHVVHNCHRAVGPSWRKVIDHFETAKLLGITATPDRADRLALGQVFESVAFVYDILPAIADGVLCRLVCKTVHCASMDLDSVGTVAGDLNEGQLDEQVVKALNDIVEALCVQRKAGDRRGLVFVPRVATAHALVGKMNAITPGCARAVDGGMVYEERNENMRAHRAGEVQWLVNVDVLTEGYDDPQVACVVNARPTKSRVRLAQAIGRGTRIAPGKTDLLVLMFTGGNRLDLVTPVDILGGKYPDDVRAEAASMLDADGGDAIEALDRAQKMALDRAELARLQAEAARLRQHRAHITTEAVDPFGAVGIEDPGPDGYGGQFGRGQPASEKQQKMLAWKGFPESMRKSLTKAQASALISKTVGREAQGYVSDPRWMATLRRAGLDPKPMRHEEARQILGYIWDNKPLPEFAKKFAAGSYQREIGEEG